MTTEDLHTWADVIEQSLSDHSITCVNRVMVMRETSSTQDVARRMSAGAPGLLVLAGRQTGGRGRLGRTWADTSHMGVAATFSVDASRHHPGTLAIAAGLAAWGAVQDSLLAAPREDGSPPPQMGLRWPNDVVERLASGPGRKISGVLIEAADGLALVGIGINVLQEEGDWPEDLRARAVSLAQLGCRATRLDVAACMVRHLDAALTLTDAELAARWTPRDVLIGSRQRFTHNAEQFAGTVISVSPASGVRIRSDNGTEHDLPPLTTSLVH